MLIELSDDEVKDISHVLGEEAATAFLATFAGRALALTDGAKVKAAARRLFEDFLKSHIRPLTSDEGLSEFGDYLHDKLVDHADLSLDQIENAFGVFTAAVGEYFGGAND